MNEAVKLQRIWHEALLDAMLVNPRITYEELSKEFDTWPGTIARIVNSDLFQARLRQRRAQMDEKLSDGMIARINGKLGKLAETSVDTLQERIEAERKKLGLGDADLVKETADMALKALGFTAPKPSQQVNVDARVVVVGRETLEAARKRMRAKGEEVIDAAAYPAALPSPA